MRLNKCLLDIGNFTILLISVNNENIFDISIASEPVGRIVFELSLDTPRTSENFKCLCTGERSTPAKPLHYLNSKFHRVIPGFMCQGGDITVGNGTGGESIFGSEFPDENFSILHSGPMILSMANKGPNTNQSQFFITTVACPWLDGKHVAFGRVIQGKEVILQVEEQGTNYGSPQKEIKVSNCGLS